MLRTNSLPRQWKVQLQSPRYSSSKQTNMQASDNLTGFGNSVMNLLSAIQATRTTRRTKLKMQKREALMPRQYSGLTELTVTQFSLEISVHLQTTNCLYQGYTMYSEGTKIGCFLKENLAWIQLRMRVMGFTSSRWNSWPEDESCWKSTSCSNSLQVRQSSAPGILRTLEVLVVTTRKPLLLMTSSPLRKHWAQSWQSVVDWRQTGSLSWRAISMCGSVKQQTASQMRMSLTARMMYTFIRSIRTIQYRDSDRLLRLRQIQDRLRQVQDRQVDQQQQHCLGMDIATDTEEVGNCQGIDVWLTII